MIIVLVQLWVFPTLTQTKDAKETMLGVVALKTKFNAINKKDERAIIIKSQTLNNQYELQYKDCNLVFTPMGTASKAGTCWGENKSLTLRPGEGGIGYPWD